MEFRCRLGTASGEIIEGVYDAQSEAALRRELEEKGLHVLSLRPRLGLARFSFGGRRKITRHEFLVFNQELATLLKAGMPLVQSLDILRTRLTNPLFKSVLDDVHDKVRAGVALSDAFAAHGDLFPRVYTASLVAGERAGNLDAVLRRFVSYSKTIDMVRSKTLSAMIYPAILVGLAGVLVSIIVGKVIPTFAEFYTSFDDAELPLMTRAIVGVSQIIRAQLLLIVVVLAGGGAALGWWLRQPGHLARFDGWLLRLPIVGASVHKFATSQLARTLATLLGGGIPLVNALEVAAGASGNRHIGHELGVVALKVREGQSLAATLLERRTVPDVAIKMIEVGESTGALTEMLNSLADFYDEEIETEVARFVTVIEPALLVIMGIVIATIVLALYMPLFQLSSVVGP
jgi:type IV pilus assembly protein PilC